MGVLQRQCRDSASHDGADDALVFPHRVMGMIYDDFDRLLTDILGSQTTGAAATDSRRRRDRSGRGVRDFLTPEEGLGYCDFFRVSDTLCVSITDARYLRDTWIGVAHSNLVKLRFLLSGRLLTESGDEFGKASEAILDISAGSTRSGYYIAPHERTRIVCLHCRPQQLTQAMGLCPADLPAPLKRLFTQEQALERLKIVPDAPVMQAVRLIAESRQRMAPALRLPYLDSLSMQILVHILNGLARKDHARSEASFLRARDLKKICDARDYLTRNFVKPPRIRELARLVGVNQTKLKSGFRGITGKSIYEYIVTCRMQRAADLLATGDYDVAEVAFKVGYAYPTNFTHAFKKFNGTLPRALTTRNQT